MMDDDSLDFSFSGLKTAVFREINKLKAMKQWNNETISFLAYEIQEAITDVLVTKTLQAVKQYNVKSILLGGGVAANKRLTEKMNLEIRSIRQAQDKNSKLEIKVHIPSPPLCTDNAAYIASFAYFNYSPVPWDTIDPSPGLPVEV